MPKTTTATRPGAGRKASTTAEIARFIARFDADVARVIRSCRRVLRRRFPAATELVYDNYNFLVFGFCATERPSDCIVSLAAASNGVGLSFPYCGARLPDPQRILLGIGSKNRFIRLPSAATLGEPAVEALLDAAAAAQSRTPPGAGGRGTTIIKSVSAKQRPRRKPSR